MDQTIVSTALPTVIRELGNAGNLYAWVGSAYLLMAACVAPLVSSRASDGNLLAPGQSLLTVTAFIYSMESLAMCLAESPCS